MKMMKQILSRCCRHVVFGVLAADEDVDEELDVETRYNEFLGDNVEDERLNDMEWIRQVDDVDVDVDVVDDLDNEDGH